MSTPGDVLEALGREARARLGRARGEGTRTYRGRTVEELIPQIERDLGADALIVSRRDGLTGGVMGFFQHAYVEIEAMAGTPRLDVYDEPHPAGPAQAGLPPPPPESPEPAHPDDLHAPEPAFEAGSALPAQATEVGHYVSPELAAMAYAEQRAEAPQPVAEPEPAPVAFDFEQLLAHAASTPQLQPPAPGQPVESLQPPAPASVHEPDAYGSVQEPAPPPPSLHTPEPVRATAPAAHAPERRTVVPGSHGRAGARIEKSLLRYGISADFAAELIEAAAAHTLPLAPRAGLAQAVLSTLARRIPVATPLPLRNVAIAMVGAGGSGKTTCAASMLAAYRSSSTLRAGCASLLAPDGEQVQMLLSPDVVSPLSLGNPRAASALRTARREGLLILDAPGVSPSERGRIRELARLLGQLEPDRVVVALPATLGAAAATQLLAALAPLRADALAVTHADETDQIGVAIEAACRHGLAPEYMLDRARGGGWALRRVDPADLAARVLP